MTLRYRLIVRTARSKRDNVGATPVYRNN